MVFLIPRKGLVSPEAQWRKNLRENSLRLGEELHGKWAKRPNLDALLRLGPFDEVDGTIHPQAVEHFRKVMAYGEMRAELPKSFRNGKMLAQVGPISEITNFNTGTTYPRIDAAIYSCSSGDEILLPAGSGATHLGTFLRYSNFSQTNSTANGYTTNNSVCMTIGNPEFTTNPATATYLSIVGIPSTNNLSSVTWASTNGGQLTATISGAAITVYRKGQYVRISGATNSGTGGAVPGELNSINNIFIIVSTNSGGSPLVLSAPASSGVYGTIGGSSIVLNNDRAQISPAVAYLTATLNNGDAVAQVDDAGDFSPTGFYLNATCVPPELPTDPWSLWGSGYGAPIGNTIPIDTSGLPAPVPIGYPVTALPYGSKGLFSPAGLDSAHGITFSNLELWGVAADRSGGAILQYSNGTNFSYGSMTLNNCFIHSSQFGIRPGNSSFGSSVFLDIIDTEIWNCGFDGGSLNHNMYVECEVLTFYNSLSHRTRGVYLIKSRCRNNYILYSRTYGERGSAPNPGNTADGSFDFPNGGAVYIIGSTSVQSLYDATSTLRCGEEATPSYSGITSNNTNRGTSNPRAEIYAVNSAFVGPSSGVGTYQSNIAPFSVSNIGVAWPETIYSATISGGSLPARSYWFSATLLDPSGNETIGSSLISSDAYAGATSQASFGANQLAVATSPLPRTGAVNYNMYAGHSDPLIYWDQNLGYIANDGSNQFFWDAGFTLPILVVNAGGTQPAIFVYVGVTYVFPEGESINYAIGGADFRFPNAVGFYTPYSPAAVIGIPANNLLTIKSPPAMAGATGWYPLVVPTPFQESGGAYWRPNDPRISCAPLSKQVLSPIAIGTDWVQTGPFFQSEILMYNFRKQNTSPIAIGTDWTEPTTGLTDHNDTSGLKWFRRGHADDYPWGVSRWYAKATANYTNYVVKIYSANRGGNTSWNDIQATIQVWSGTTSPWPFDSDYNSSSTIVDTSSTATTAASSGVILASFCAYYSNPLAGSGYTQTAALPSLMTEYKAYSSPQTGLPVTQAGSVSCLITVDAITGTSLALRGTPQTVANNIGSTFVTFTIPTINTGDLLVMDCAIFNSIVFSVDPIGQPAQSATSIGMIGSVINCVNAYYYDTALSASAGTNGWLQTYPGIQIYPAYGYPTVSPYNLQVSTWNGTSLNAPLIGSVWADATNYDFTPVTGSPLINAGTNPGTGGGFSLVPVYQTSMIGTPTAGYPIQPLTARTDNGVTLGAVQSGGAPPPTPGGAGRRMFLWDWKTTVTVGTIALLGKNPVVSRRKMLSLPKKIGK